MSESGQDDVLCFPHSRFQMEKVLSLSACEQPPPVLLSSFPLGTFHTFIVDITWFPLPFFFFYQWHHRCKPTSSPSVSGELQPYTPTQDALFERFVRISLVGLSRSWTC